ncbi:MAG: hypothetical protein ACYDB9_04215 [Gammaproteobacteria bacterium]
MLSRAAFRWMARGCAAGAVLVLFGCSSSSKPYTLVAQLPPLSQQARIVAATIDVQGSICNVRIVTLDASKAWRPVCLVNKDQPTYKSLTIGGQEVDFGAVGNGFKVLSATLPTLPGLASSAASAATGAAAAKVKAATATQAPAAASSPVAQVAAPSFPEQWNLSPYPGHVKLQGQNRGFLVTSAILTINGSEGTLDVTYKTSYKPLHLKCTVIANQKGNFTLLFNPSKSVNLTGGGNYSVLLSSEGESISGNIWDSHGFDTWTPSLPPQWVAVSYSSG